MGSLLWSFTQPLLTGNIAENLGQELGSKRGFGGRGKAGMTDLT